MSNSRSLFSVLIIASVIIPSVSFAYNVADYNPQYTPYNLEAAIDARLCKEELAAFDSDYDALSKSYTENLTEVILSSGVQGSLSNVSSWLEANEFYYSNAFRDCIAEDTATEEAKAKKEAQERFELKEQAKLQKAIDECDMEYLEGLSIDKKMSTYDERMACKEKIATVASEVSEPKTAPTPVYVPTVTTYVPEPVTYTAPAVPVSVASAPVIPEEKISDPSSEVVEGDQATTSASTTEEKVVEMTEDELNQIIEQRVDEALKASQPEPSPEPEKPSFFRRVINFFKGWF